jgi:hypothetical protein
MTTVKEFKDGAELRMPIYVEKPYVVLGDNGNGGQMVLGSGELSEILKWVENITYYDHCEIDIREYDLYLNNNTRVDGWTLFYTKEEK